MKVLLLLSTSFIASTRAFDEAHRLDPSIPTVSPHGASAESCVGQCAFTFVEALNTQVTTARAAGLLNLNFNDFLVAFSNTTFFEQFCGIYHSFQHCSSHCDHSYLNELLTRSAEIVDHYCVYNYDAIREKFPCLSRVEVPEQCVRTCTPHHDAVSSLMQNFKNLALNGDSSAAEKYLAESCEYVICTLHCDVPAVAHTCDFDTANLVVNLTRRSFASMETMALDTGAVSKWPEVCADIKTYALPSPAKPPETPAAQVIAASPEAVAIVREDPRTGAEVSNGLSSLFTSSLLSLLLTNLFL